MDTSNGGGGGGGAMSFNFGYPMGYSAGGGGGGMGGYAMAGNPSAYGLPDFASFQHVSEGARARIDSFVVLFVVCKIR